MLQQIRDWLNGNRDYHYGIILLKQCPNATEAIINLLVDVGPNIRNTARLHKHLLEAYESARDQAPEVVVQASDRIEEAKSKPHSSFIIHNSSLFLIVASIHHSSFITHNFFNSASAQLRSPAGWSR